MVHFMGAVKSCNYIDCYYNNNLEHLCTLKEITLDFTGTCENITHCDEYECDTCAMANQCLKDKKAAREND